jgi:hypothetical protein
VLERHRFTGPNLDDPRIDRASGGRLSSLAILGSIDNEGGRSYGLVVCVLIAAAILIAPPFVLLALTFVEEWMFSAYYTSELYEALRIIKPLQVALSLDERGLKNLSSNTLFGRTQIYTA